jgi:hypothetical protein
VSDIFYFNPGCINYTKGESLNSLSVSPFNCQPSKFLEDHKLEHDDLTGYDTILDKKISSCVQAVYDNIEAEFLRRRFYWERLGLEWCIIL